MSYKVLARRHRPQVFADIIGHAHLVSALKLAISKNQIGHAYLFTGTRGIGKTTIARIFAKSIRCLNLSKESEPCNQCICCKNFEDSIDVVEIDGASNNSVENVRELITSAQYLPTTGSRKIYIIDEVHMLSASAFNALLKTLEEPPSHVVFILATTDPNKLPETITSRCQRFDFINATDLELNQLIDKILQSEEMELENSSLKETIVKFSQGSYRDCLSILEKIIQFRHQKTITEEFLFGILGVPPEKLVKELMVNIIDCKGNGTLSVFNQILQTGTSLENLITALLDCLYTEVKQAMESQSSNLAELIWIFESIGKDAGWTLKGKNSRQLAAVSLIKISSRDQLFKKTPTHHQTPVPKKNEELEKKKLIEDKIRNCLYFSTDKLSPTIRTNVIHSELSDMLFENEVVSLMISFKSTDEIFYEFVSDELIRKKIEDALVIELGLAVKVNFAILSAQDSVNFQSYADKMVKAKEDQNKVKESRIKNDPIIQKAEALFGKKIDKIVLNTTNKD
jgi:DNA polymerase-3 subunit gamma/tau